MNLKQTKIVFILTIIFFVLTLTNWWLEKYTVTVPSESSSLISQNEINELVDSEIENLGDIVKKKRERNIKLKDKSDTRREVIIDVPNSFSAPDFIKTLNETFQDKNIKVSAVENFKMRTNTIHILNNNRVSVTLILE